MIKKEYKTKAFIRSFNFSNPDWRKLSSSFPYLEENGLTREEKHLLDGIKLAWMATTNKGRKKFYQQIRLTVFTFLLIVLSAFTILNFTRKNQEKIAKTVNAASIKAEDIIQSTVSAILRR